MSLTDDVTMLRAIPLFAGVSPIKLKLLAFTSDRVTFKAGQHLFCEGDPSRAAFVIMSGSAALSRKSDQGAVTVAEAQARSVVGEAALMSDRAHDVTAVAVTQCETLRIDRQRFRDLLATCPHTMSQVMRALSDRVTRAH